MKRTVICLVLLIMLACDKSYENTIPYRPVYLDLDLAFKDKALLSLQAYKFYITPSLAVERTGFGGVLVYHGINSSGTEAYYAFDAACPHEAKSDVRVSVDADAIYAVCPQCGSKYELLNGIGNPVSGPSKYMLQQYQTSLQGSTIYVRN